MNPQQRLMHFALREVRCRRYASAICLTEDDGEPQQAANPANATSPGDQHEPQPIS
jgi:hypothetical protein